MRTSYKQEKPFFEVRIERSYPKPKAINETGFSLFAETSQLHLDGIEHAKQLIKFLQEFVTEYERDEKEVKKDGRKKRVSD